MRGNPYQAYKQNSIYTATPQELTLMLYEGAIKFCNRGIEALDNHRLEEAHTAIIRVQDIIEELKVTLDRKHEISLEIDRLYEFILELLVESNINKDRVKLEQALELIREFRDLWNQVIKVNKGLAI